jgi:CHAT domain-containing protein/tetratricopeptide (TPR) repeat protein
MTEPNPAPASDIPAICAILYGFDAESLQALADLDREAAHGVLATPDIVPFTAYPGRFRLSPPAQAALLERLRRERPRDEPALHRRAFDYYQRRLAADPFDEAAALHHLRTLRELNLDYMRWSEIDSLIEALRAVGPLQPQHNDELTLYAAANAMRAQQYERSEALLQGLLARDDLTADLQASAWNTLGILTMVQAQFDRAMSCFETALGIAGPINPSHRGGALVNQSWVYHHLNQFDTALDLSHRSLEHFLAANDLYGAAFARYTIGNNALYLGRWAVAQEHLAQAAAIYTAAGMDARSAMVEWAHGLLYQILGDDSRSEAAYLNALRAAESPEYANPFTARDTLEMLGLLYHTQDRLDEAAAAFTRAIAIGDSVRDEQQQAQAMHRLGVLLLERGRRGAALDTLRGAIDRIEQIRAATQGESLKIGLLGTVQQVYETMVLACLHTGDTAAAFGYIERARARALLDVLARRDPDLAASLAQNPVTLADAHAMLRPGALLLEYYTVGIVPRGAHFLEHIPPQNQRLRELLLPPPEIILFAVTSEHMEVHRIAFDPNRLQPLPGDPTPGRQLLTARKLSWLYTQLLAPVEHLLAGMRSLHIIPHGPLHFVPFAALQVSGGQYLLSADGPSVSYAPSTTVLRACLERQASGDIDMTLGYNGAGATALRFAEHEARRIAQLTDSQAIVGSIAKSQRLAELAARVRRLHIASHAVFLPQDPLGSYLLLGADDRLDARTVMGSTAIRATLVTLNACTSGLSHIASGDELLGLPRAFLYAGASTIVCALHDVDDLAAYMLMVYFYENLAHGQAPATALHQAQLLLRTQRRDEIESMIQRLFSEEEQMTLPALANYDPIPFAHPRYWAPFIVIGRP